MVDINKEELINRIRDEVTNPFVFNLSRLELQKFFMVSSGNVQEIKKYDKNDYSNSLITTYNVYKSFYLNKKLGFRYPEDSLRIVFKQILEFSLLYLRNNKSEFKTIDILNDEVDTLTDWGLEELHYQIDEYSRLLLIVKHPIA